MESLTLLVFIQPPNSCRVVEDPQRICGLAFTFPILSVIMFVPPCLYPCRTCSGSNMWPVLVAASSFYKLQSPLVLLPLQCCERAPLPGSVFCRECQHSVFSLLTCETHCHQRKPGSDVGERGGSFLIQLKWTKVRLENSCQVIKNNKQKVLWLFP